VSYTLGQKQLDRIEDILKQDLINNGVRCVFLIDMAGNIIANLDNGEKQHDIYSLAALAAGNFGAVSAMAKIIGENEFSLLFHKGKKENIHDTVKCASRYVDIIGARVFKKEDIRELAKYSDVPIINMLDDWAHPCQILCDYQAILEKIGRLHDIKFSYFGDAFNNVTYDLMRMAAIYGLKMEIHFQLMIVYT